MVELIELTQQNFRKVCELLGGEYREVKDKEVCIFKLHETWGRHDGLSLRYNIFLDVKEPDRGYIDKYPITVMFGEKGKFIVIKEPNLLPVEVASGVYDHPVIMYKPKGKDYIAIVIPKVVSSVYE